MLNMSICNWTQNEPEQTQLEISRLETDPTSEGQYWKQSLSSTGRISMKAIVV